MKFLNSKRALYTSLGVLVVVVFGGLAYIGAIKAVTTPVATEEGEQFEATSIVFDAENELYNVFTNNAIGYSFEYPKSWVLDDADLATVRVSAGGEGSKYIQVDVPYPLNILGEDTFMSWAETQEWPFSPTLPSEYFEEVTVPSGLSTYKKAGTSTVQTVIAPIDSNVVYINRVNGTGEGSLNGEDVYFHLLNSLRELQ